MKAPQKISFSFFFALVFYFDAQSQSIPFGIYSFAVNGNRIFAGTSGGGIYFTENNSISWETANNGLQNSYVNSLVINGNNIFAGTERGIFISTDNGRSWKAINNGLTNIQIHSIAINGNNIYVGTFGGVFLSINNGESWSSINNGLTNTFVYAIGLNGNNIYAGTSSGIFSSNDNGSSWVMMNNGLTNKYIKTLYVKGDSIFCGTDGGGLFLSIDNCNNWTSLSNGLSNKFVNSISIKGKNIFIGTFGGGMFLSNNMGLNWLEINNGIIDKRIYTTTIFGTNILAGTFAGIFLSDNNGESWKAVNNGNDLLSNNFEVAKDNPKIQTNSITTNCFPPHRFYISINSSQVKISWGNLGDSVTYNFQYQIASKSKNYSVPSSWNYINNIKDTSVTLSELKPNSKYFYQVQTVCPHSSSVINTVGYSDFNSFETQQDENYLPDIEEYAGVWEDYNFATAAYGIYSPTYRIVIDTSNTVTFYSKGAMQDNLNLNCQMRFSSKALIKGVDQNYYRYNAISNGDCKYFIEIFPPKPESAIKKFQSGEWRTETIPSEPMKLYLCFEDWRKPLYSKTQVDLEQIEQQESNVIYKWKK